MSGGGSRFGGGNRGGGDRSGGPRGPSDSARGGFGGRRWGDEFASDRGDERPIDRPSVGSAFGGHAWQESIADPPMDVDLDGDGEEEEAPRRRRQPQVPLHPRRTVSALGGTVRIVRDGAAVPHVIARSERDAWVGLGVCMAADRLWQMDVLRRLATGRAAELFGESFVFHDALVRTAGVGRRAAAAASRLSGLARDVLAAFTAGVNSSRADGRPAEAEALAYEIEPWTIADSLAIEMLAAWNRTLGVWPAKLLVARAIASAGIERGRWISGMPLDVEVAGEERAALWRRIDPRLFELLERIPRPSIAGDVAFAAGEGGGVTVAGASATGAMIPGGAYLAHLEAPGLSVAGAVQVGTPILSLGRSRTCAWASTGVEVDDADCVLEELDGIGNFRTESGWSKLAVHREVVRVRGGESVVFEVAETRNGPLVSHLAAQLLPGSGDSRAPGVVVRWGANATGSSVAGWIGVARAKNAADMAGAAGALDRAPGPATLVAGDTGGRARSWITGVVPIRESRARLPVWGWCSEAPWTGMQDLSPRSAAGESGSPDFLTVASECLPGVASVDPAVASPETPLRRVWSALAGMGAGDRCIAALLDVGDASAPSRLALVRRALEGAQTTEGLREATRPLAEWDGSATTGSAGAALYHLAIFSFLPRELFPEARFGPLVRCDARLAWRATERLLAADVSPWFADEGAKHSAIRAAVERAADWLEQRFGPDPASWSWGAIHVLAPRHPLAGRDGFPVDVPEPRPVPGSPVTLQRFPFDRCAPPFDVTTVPGARMVADLSGDEIRLSLFAGQSGRPGDAHFLDQLVAWSEGRFLTLKLATDVAGEISELIQG